MSRIVLGALVALGVLIPVSFFPAQGSGIDGSVPPGGMNPAPALTEGDSPLLQVDTIVVQIVADADSVIAVPSSVTVRRGQVVTWACELGEWTVKFKSGQPFGDAAVGEGIKGNRGQRNGQAVRADAEYGSYKYDIMVRIQGGRNLTADPEVVVGPGDGPGE
ncbi:MAG: hypothetical protein ACWGSQ_03810 [Longimicrobiales bacterium]